MYTKQVRWAHEFHGGRVCTKSTEWMAKMANEWQNGLKMVWKSTGRMGSVWKYQKYQHLMRTDTNEKINDIRLGDHIGDSDFRTGPIIFFACWEKDFEVTYYFRTISSSVFRWLRREGASPPAFRISFELLFMRVWTFSKRVLAIHQNLGRQTGTILSLTIFLLFSLYWKLILCSIWKINKILS